jgi:hypothetical protein
MANTTSIASTTACRGCAALIPLGPDSSFTIGGVEYCFRCLKSPMDAMIGSPTAYPCVVSGVALDPGMFPAALLGGEEAFEKYKNLFDMKKTEWTTPAANRVYCDCPVGMFVGAVTNPRDVGKDTFAGCGSCMQVYCMKCRGKTDESAASIRAHLH